MNNLQVHFSSRSDEWETPYILFHSLCLEFQFTLDPCATKENAKCPTFFTKEENGLVQNWGTHVVFMNPPYGRQIKNWVQKAYESSQHGATVVCLIPSRTDTAWWHDYCMKGEIRFLRGRVKFINRTLPSCKDNGDFKTSPAPFPSAIVVFRPATFRLQS